MAGFWKAPRALARMLIEREITPTEFALLSFVAESGADQPDGFLTSPSLLAGAFRLNEKKVWRALRSLRAHGLIDFDDHPGAAAFTVTLTRRGGR